MKRTVTLFRGMCVWKEGKVVGEEEEARRVTTCQLYGERVRAKGCGHFMFFFTSEYSKRALA